MSDLVFTKPTITCLLLHQIAWEEHEVNPNWIYCHWCKKTFLWPTKRDMKPVYTK